MGIPNAQRRYRKFMIKTARVRGGDGSMKLYRFDYLGAPNSTYSNEGRITSYGDAHNITIVDELVEQSACELDPAGEGDCTEGRSEFYIYEDDFRLVLDPVDLAATPPSAFSNAPLYREKSHYLYIPVRVKSRRVVTMNFYGEALSDRLILNPGYNGDQTQLVDDQQYELINKRGQAKHVYDPSWVAALREGMKSGGITAGLEAVEDKGRVLVELCGGEGGWYSVLRGIAWGSDGGNAYNQQCRTPAVLEDVPVQRVAPDALVVIEATKQFSRTDGESSVEDMPEVKARFYATTKYDASGLVIVDSSGLVGVPGAGTDDAGCLIEPDVCTCSEDTCFDDGPGYGCFDELGGLVDLHNQDPVPVTALPGEGGVEDDGTSIVRFAYTFYDDGQNALGQPIQRRLKWKYQWEEKVSPSHGGSGNVALQILYFDEAGRIRFQGRGAGSDTAIHRHLSHRSMSLTTDFIVWVDRTSKLLISIQALIADSGRT